MITVLMALLFLFPQEQENPILTQSKEQVNHYLTLIEQDSYKKVGIWALSVLAESNSEITAYLNNRLAGIENHDIPNSFTNNHVQNLKRYVLLTGDQALLIAILLNQENEKNKLFLSKYGERHGSLSVHEGIDYPGLAGSIIEGSSITENLLSLDTFRFIHFLLFLHSPDISDNLYEETISKWSKFGTNAVSNPTLNFFYWTTKLRILYRIDRYSEIEPLYNAFFENTYFPNSSAKLKIFRNLSFAMYNQGYYDRSLNIQRTITIPLAEFLNQKSTLLNIKLPQGVNFYQIRKIKEAQNTYLEVAEEAEQLGIELPESIYFNNLAITYLKEGNFDEYLNLQFKALEKTQEKEKLNYEEQLRILDNLYIFYRNNGDKSSALSYLNKSAALAQNQGNNADLGRINTYKGVIYKKFDNNYSKALEFFEEAQAQLDSTNYVPYIELLFEKARLFKEQNSFRKSIDVYREIAAISRDKDNVNHLDAQIGLADIYLATNRLDTAAIYIDKFEEADLSSLNFEDIVKAKTVQARYLVKTGHNQKAYTVLKPAIEQTLNWARNSANIQSGYWNIEPEFIDAFQFMADLLIETSRPGEAVEVLDKLKTINDASLYQNPMVRSSLLSEKELTRYQQINTQLDALRKKQLTGSEEQYRKLQNRIEQLNVQKRLLDQKISDFTDRPPISTYALQRKLNGREMVLHITELNEELYIASIFKNEIRFQTVPLDDKSRSYFEKAMESLSTGNTDLHQLYEITQLLGLTELPSWINTITIIPDSYLFQLPIDVLPVNKPEFPYSYGQAHYVVEKFNTHYVTSIGDFKNSSTSTSRSEYTWNFAGYGVSEFDGYQSKQLVPLPYAKREVSHIAQNFTNLGNITSYTDSESSEATFKNTASQARILHLATHSELSERDPLYSTIYMSPDSSYRRKDFEGQIFAYELFELNLNNDLIMLNSCESGSGSYLQGAGVMGISRALQYAGARSLILNIWSVNDMMASDFAITFYKHLNEGTSRTEALQSAKLHFIKEKNANPHFWGPYMLIGDQHPLVKPFEKSNLYFATGFMLFFVILLAISLFKQNSFLKR